MKKQEILNYFDDELMDKLFAFSYARTNDSYEAQELCSDIIFALVKAAHSEGEITNLYPFIWRVARNVYFDFLKDKKRHQAVFCEGSLEEEVASVPDREEEESRELLEAIYRQIAFLTKIYREVMIMYYIDGVPTAEIAKRLNISETTVRQRLLWARHKVKDEVKDMEKAYDKPLSLDKMDYAIWGNGNPDWGDPRDLCVRTLSKHIIWLCRKKPMGAAEIAEKLNVPTAYIEEEMEILAHGKNGEYGLIKQVGNDRYVINFILLDEATMKKAVQIYAEQIPKVSQIIADYVQKHRAEYLKFPYLNQCFVNGEPDFNLVLWQQMFVIAGAFRENVGRILAETYFADEKEPERPFSVFGHIAFRISYAAGIDESYAENLCGFRWVKAYNLGLSHIGRHFTAGHNISTDPQLQMALRAIRGLKISSLTSDEKEHAAKAVERGYLYREGEWLYTKILVCPMREEGRLLEVSRRLSSGHFEEEAQAVAERIAALIKKSVPRHLFGEWQFANALAGMQSVNLVENALIEQGILIPPKDRIGAEGCWMSVYE
ncbi:MAG: sigma-70 family RNA polymerase sigma factor [Muribaculum sp.]|nr:sigma-70 family RNA polymerase sigma factor [Ruminococcus flavefaciens]MCM1373633.1 sigma-70 family RNA polymerase sigma factor [Muribaculum sp.]